MRTDQLFWYVKNFDCNTQVIEDYNVLAGREKQIKKLKKKCTNRATFSEELKKEMMWQYWSRAEYWSPNPWSRQRADHGDLPSVPLLSDLLFFDYQRYVAGSLQNLE